MKIVTWNVNSIKVRAEFVADYLDRVRPEILCLQELKVDAAHVPREVFTSRGYELAVHAQKTWNGVLIASQGAITDVVEGLGEAEEGQARMVACSTLGVRIVNLYCPQGQSVKSPKFMYKLRFYEALRAWVARDCDLGAPFVLCGDLNIAPGPEDIWDPFEMEGVPSYHPLEHQELEALMDLGLYDAVKPHIQPGTYTFWDYRAGMFHKNQGMRIDHLLVSEPLRERVTGAWVEREERKKKDELKPSDHAPVVIEVDLA